MMSRIRHKPEPPPGTAELPGIQHALNKIIVDCKLLPAAVAIHFLSQAAQALETEEREHRRKGVGV